MPGHSIGSNDDTQHRVATMAARKPFLLRTEPETFAALQRWAADELRSVNGQIDFILRRALQRAGRLPKRADNSSAAAARSGSESPDGGHDEER